MQSRVPKAILLLAWLSALSAMVAISLYYAGDSTQFFGIADDQEQTIRFKAPVEIVSYGFVSGQKVATGDLIVEVRRLDLEAELQIIQERIQALKFGNREARASMQSEIVQLQADLQAATTELDSQIRRLRARESAARSFLDGMTREGNAVASGESAVQQEIASLQVRERALKRSTAAKINDLNSRLTTPERPIDAQIAELVKQQQNLERQRTELSVYAKIEGRVGSVLFKVGDTVPPYQPVLTVHGSKPTFVKGYIHENVLNDVTLDQTVWVRSANSMHASVWHEGVVESLGSRIVEFPVRLKVNPLAQAWGREVVVRLEDDHVLLLGEKVSVQLDPPIQYGFSELKAFAAEVAR
ncbi:MAG: HlyD family secretion protein [Pseudomonadales bacterium]